MMINIVTFISKQKLSSIKPSQEMFVFQLSSHNEELDIQKGYAGSFSIKCFDDACELKGNLPITYDQASKLFYMLEEIDDLDERIDLFITCDTGITLSATVALFIRDHYKRTRIYKAIPQESINKNAYLKLKLATHRSISSRYSSRLKNDSNFSIKALSKPIYNYIINTTKTILPLNEP
jgi:mannitol-specific phosphotransferase system IIBC component